MSYELIINVNFKFYIAANSIKLPTIKVYIAANLSNSDCTFI